MTLANALDEWTEHGDLQVAATSGPPGGRPWASEFSTTHYFWFPGMPVDRRRKSLVGNLDLHYYEAGHMMYIHMPSLKAQAKHLRDFVKKAK